MKIRKSQLITTYLFGIAASAIAGGDAIVLVILMTLLVAGSLIWMCLDLRLKWPQSQLSLGRHFENSTPKSAREAYVLGVGHHVRR